jgi:5-methyltetrahydrofolate--homocysteine methyltransferase
MNLEQGAIMSETLLQAITSRVLLGDGAMGTQLQRAGLEPGGCGKVWNVTHPDRVLAIGRSYVEAGSDLLITNTFGGCRLMLERHELADQTVAINKQAARIARQAFGTERGYVLGDIGPFGGMMEPLGDVPEARVRDALQEQADALVEGGVDAVIVETQTSLEELTLGVEVARQAGAPCIIGSMAYDVSHDGNQVRTMMGVSPTDAARCMVELGVDVVALNCGTGIDMIQAALVLGIYRSVCKLPLMAQPNAGQPILENMQVCYKQTPAEMAADLEKLLAAGANIIGACCGSSPEHIRQLRPIIDEHNERAES